LAGTGEGVESAREALERNGDGSCFGESPAFIFMSSISCVVLTRILFVMSCLCVHADGLDTCSPEVHRYIRAGAVVHIRLCRLESQFRSSS
jgi:hypothetical protein